MMDAQVSPGEVLDLACRLVAMPSHGPEHGWESGVVHVLEELFRSAGIATRRQPVQDGRENLIAMLPGVKDGPPMLMLNGHMDTVPPSSSMARPPFAAEVENGWLWGRGAADMKGGLAAMAMALIALRRAGVRPPRPIMLAAVAMEEMGNVGTHVLALDMAAAGAPASCAVVGEPTALQIVTAHKGVDRYEVTVFGRAAHSATPEQGLNAIVRASRLVVALEAQLVAAANRRTHPRLGIPSYNIGTIHGGVSRNTVPDRCTFQIEKRYLPGETPAQFREDLERLIAVTIGPGGASLRHEPGYDEIDHRPLDIGEDHQLVRTLSGAIEDVTARQPEIVAWPAFTDAAILQAQGVPAVVSGPGALAMAHADGERVQVDELHAATRIYVSLVRRLAAAG